MNKQRETLLKTNSSLKVGQNGSQKETNLILTVSNHSFSGANFAVSFRERCTISTKDIKTQRSGKAFL